MAETGHTGPTPAAIFFTHRLAAERIQQVQPGVIFAKTAIADFVIAEGLLDVPEGMLHFRSNTGLDFFAFQFFTLQHFPGTGPFNNEPVDVMAVLVFIPLLNAKITGLSEDLMLFIMQQLCGGHNVVNNGWGVIGAVNQALLVVDTDVHLHAEVLLVALPGLIHLQRSADAVAFAGAFLVALGAEIYCGIEDAPFTPRRSNREPKASNMRYVAR